MARAKRRGTRLAVVLLLMAAIFGATQRGAPGAAQVVPLGGDTAAPTAVIAQGVATLPNDDLAWRVVRAEARSQEDQPTVTPATGFVVAGSGSLVLSDLVTTNQELLSRGEAVWVAGGSEQQRAALTEDTTAYTELSLVADDAADVTSDADLIYAGSPFNAPGNARDIELTMAIMEPGQTVEVEVTNGESLVLVSEGMVSVSTGGDLASGDAQAYAEDVTLTNDTNDDATVMYATIGDVVPPLPTFTGSATLQVRACPDGATASSFIPITCRSVDGSDGFGVNLLNEAYTALPEDGRLVDGEQTWDDLEYGIYPWGAPTLPPLYVGTLWTDTASVPLDVAQVTISASDPDVTHILYVFPVTTGSVTVTIANCPLGVTAFNLASATCGEPLSPSSSVILSAPGGETLDVTDAILAGGSYQFNGLPVLNNGDLYVIDQPLPPGGYVEYLIVAGGSGQLNAPAGIALTSANPFVSVTIFNFQPLPIPTTTPIPLPTVTAIPAAPATVSPPQTEPPTAVPSPTALGSLDPPPAALNAATGAEGCIALHGIDRLAV